MTEPYRTNEGAMIQMWNLQEDGSWVREKCGARLLTVLPSDGARAWAWYVNAKDNGNRLDEGCADSLEEAKAAAEESEA